LRVSAGSSSSPAAEAGRAAPSSAAAPTMTLTTKAFIRISLLYWPAAAMRRGDPARLAQSRAGLQRQLHSKVHNASLYPIGSPGWGMDLRQLRYFVGIVEHGSFSKAAAHLNVAQPALSQHVRHMEQELGVELLHRGTHGVMPTEAGDRLIRHARTILAEFAELQDSVRSCEGSP